VNTRNATPPRFGDVLLSFRTLNAPSILFFYQPHLEVLNKRWWKVVMK
jgi:hypothetical protein